MTDLTLTTTLAGAQQVLSALDRIEGNLGDIAQTQNRAAASAERAAQRTITANRAVAASYRFLRNAAIAALGSFGVRELVRTIDQYRLLESRISLVTRSTEELAQTQARLFRIAQQARVSLLDTSEVFTRFARVGREFGITNETILDFTEQVQKLGVISGATTQEIRNALIQLSQGFGRLGGEELRSVREQLPAVLQLIAREAGVTTNELVALGAKGKLSADLIVRAVLNAAEETDKAFARIQTTFGQAFTRLGNSLTRVIGEFDKAAGGGRLTEPFVALSEAIDESLPAILSLPRALNGTLSPTEQLSDGMKALATGLIAVATLIEVSFEATLGNVFRLLGRLGTELIEIGDVAILVATGKFAEAGKALEKSQRDGLEAFKSLARDSTTSIVGAVQEAVTLIQQIYDETKRGAERAGDAARDFGNDLGGAGKQIDDATKKARDFIKELISEVDFLEHLNAAHGQSAVAIDQVNTARELQLALQKAGVELGTAEGEIIADLIVQRRFLKEAIEEQVEAEREAERVAREAERERERETQRAARDAVRAAKRAADEVRRPILQAAQSIQQGFADAFFNIFRGSENRDLIGSFIDFVKDAFARMLSELAALAIARRVINPLLGNILGGSVGGGILGGGGSLLGAGGAAAGGGLLGIGGSPIVTGGGSLGSIVSGIGAVSNLRGFGGLGSLFTSGGSTTALSGAGIGDLAAGAPAGSGLSALLGPAALGFAGGGILASLTGGNQTTGGIGGALGAAAGSFFGGPIGAVIGGAAGGFLGGLLGGGKPSDRTQKASVNIQTGSVFNVHGLSGDRFSQENRTAAVGLAQSLSSFVGSRGPFSAPEHAEFSVGNQSGIRVFVNGSQVATTTNPNSALQAVIERLQLAAVGPPLVISAARGLQTGGSFIAASPTLLTVGERGPERVSARPINAGGGADGVAITFNGPVILDDLSLGDFARRLRRDIAGADRVV